MLHFHHAEVLVAVKAVVAGAAAAASFAIGQVSGDIGTTVAASVGGVVALASLTAVLIRGFQGDNRAAEMLDELMRENRELRSENRDLRRMLHDLEDDVG